MKWILKEFDDFANKKKLKDPCITESFIKEWRATRVADCERTLYAKYSAWCQLTKLMCRRGCVCFIPRMPSMPKSNFTPYIFTEKQIAELFSYIDNSRLYDVRLGTALISMPTIFRLLYSTGMRISEVLSLKNKDVHIDEGYIHLKKTKNGCERIVPLGTSMKSVLIDYIEHRNMMPITGISNSEGLLFVKSDGTSIRRGIILVWNF